MLIVKQGGIVVRDCDLFEFLLLVGCERVYSGLWEVRWVWRRRRA